MVNAINIILDENQPLQQFPEFIEIETDTGKSISIGHRIMNGNYTRLRITIEDIKNIKEV